MSDQSLSSERLPRPPGDALGGHDQRAAKDYFIVRDGAECAGSHLIIDLWETDRLGDTALAERCLRAMARAGRATLLHVHVHRFGPEGGVSGVAVLAESHISMHTWPERGFAAFDVFMCGQAESRLAVPVLERMYRPGRIAVTEFLRGRARP